MPAKTDDKKYSAQPGTLDEKCLKTLRPFFKQCLSINHDLNNPLAGIVGYGEFLLDEAQTLSEDQREYVHEILKCAERMKKIIEDYCEAKQELADRVDLSWLTGEPQRHRQ